VRASQFLVILEFYAFSIYGRLLEHKIITFIFILVNNVGEVYVFHHIWTYIAGRDFKKLFRFVFARK
jgi:hypothetical protein